MNEDIKTQIRDRLIAGAVNAVFTAAALSIVAYFTILALDKRVSALEINSVRKDVLAETIQPMKEATLRIEQKLDRLIERER